MQCICWLCGPVSVRGVCVLSGTRGRCRTARYIVTSVKNIQWAVKRDCPGVLCEYESRSPPGFCVSTNPGAPFGSVGIICFYGGGVGGCL